MIFPPSPAAATPGVNRAASVTLMGLLLAAVLYFAAFHLRMITLPGPQEARESAVTLTTDLMLAGGKPYTLDGSPNMTNVYGIVYNYAVLPAAWLWGPTFAVHRAASLVFLLMGAGLIYGALRRTETGRGLALAGAVFYYLFNTATYAIVSRPDTLGNTIYLAVIILALPGPARAAPSLRRLALSAALGVLAFYTKPYFVLSLALATGVLAVTAGLRRAVLYAAAAGTLLLASLYVVSYIWPYYLFSVYTSHVYAEIDPPGYFWLQFKDFLFLHAGLLVIAVAVGAVWLRRIDAESHQAPRDLLSQCRLVRPEPWMLCLVFSFAATGIILGSHVGAFRIYWVQLVTPFLILVGMPAIARARAYGKTLGLAFLILNAAILLTWARPPWPEDSGPPWAQWHSVTAGHPWQLLPPHMTAAVHTPGVPVIDDGQMAYFSNVVTMHLSPDDPIFKKVTGYNFWVLSLIEQRRFDVIVEGSVYFLHIPPEFLKKHYDPYTFEIPIYYLRYNVPSQYGQQAIRPVAWIRKPGPEHAAILPAAPAQTPAPPAANSPSIAK